MSARNINLAPYDAQQAEIDRRRRMAQLLQQQGMQPLEMPQQPGAAISPYAGLAKILQSFMGSYQEGKLDKKQRELAAALQADREKQAQATAQAVVPPANVPSMSIGMDPSMTGLPPQGDDPRRVQQVQAFARALSSPDPMQQQIAPVMIGDIMGRGKEQRAAATQQAQTAQQQAFQAGEAEKTRALQLALAGNKPEGFTLGEGQQRFDPSGQLLASGTPRPAPAPPRPQTVTTDKGIFILNPDGTLGSRLGDRPPSQAATEPLVPTTDQFGNTVYTPRSQAAGLKVPTSSQNKPPTSAERKMLGFYERVSNAVDPINQMEGDIAKMDLADQARLRYAPNIFQTPVGKRFTQAANDFINASLRRESGAAISDAEYKRFQQIYFPMPGDDAPTLAQKKKARDIQVQSFITESGKAFTEKYGDVAKPGGTGASGGSDAVIELERGPDGKLRPKQ